MPRDRILALDLATRTGYAVLDLDGKRIDSGTWQSTPTAKHPCRWQRWLDGFTKVSWEPWFGGGLACIAVEASISYGDRGRANSGRIGFGLRAHLELWASRRGIEIAEFAPATVKLVAAGKGNASKAQVATAMRRRFRLAELAGGDEADALAVGVTALERLDLEELRCGHVVERPRAKKRRAAA